MLISWKTNCVQYLKMMIRSSVVTWIHSCKYRNILDKWKRNHRSVCQLVILLCFHRLCSFPYFSPELYMLSGIWSFKNPEAIETGKLQSTCFSCLWHWWPLVPWLLNSYLLSRYLLFVTLSRRLEKKILIYQRLYFSCGIRINGINLKQSPSGSLGGCVEGQEESSCQARIWGFRHLLIFLSLHFSGQCVPQSKEDISCLETWQLK